MLHWAELMLNFTGLGKEAEMLLLRFVLIIFLHATKLPNSLFCGNRI